MTANNNLILDICVKLKLTCRDHQPVIISGSRAQDLHNKGTNSMSLPISVLASLCIKTFSEDFVRLSCSI